MNEQDKGIFENDEKIQENYDFKLKKPQIEETQTVAAPQVINQVAEKSGLFSKISVSTIILVFVVLILIAVVVILIVKRPKENTALLEDVQKKYIDAKKDLKQIQQKYGIIVDEKKKIEEANEDNIAMLEEYKNKLQNAENQMNMLNEAKKIENGELSTRKSHDEVKQERFSASNEAGEKRKEEDKNIIAPAIQQQDSDIVNINISEGNTGINVDEDLIN